jgi:DNA mismatch repair protein MutS2
MEFDRDTLAPTFRFRADVPGSSHAFDIAERFGLGHNLVQHARQLIGEQSNRIEDLTASLEVLQQEARARKTEAERELGAARAVRMDFERKRDEAEEIRRTAKKRASEEAEEILKRANQFVERAVREAKEAVAKPEVASENLRAMRLRQEQERKKLMADLSVAEVPSVPEDEIVIGTSVRLKSNPTQIGKVLSVKGNEIEIEIGSLRMRTKRDQIEVVSNADAKGKTRAGSAAPREISTATKYLSTTVERRIDLRGEYGDDAVIKVDRFLADASAHGLERVEIIHGHGTGALSHRITQHLRGHEFVQSYRFGEPREGGAGVTIVEIK